MIARERLQLLKEIQDEEAEISQLHQTVKDLPEKVECVQIGRLQMLSAYL